MKIKTLILENFRGFKNLSLEFKDSNLAVFIGKNGSGKSSILDAILILLNEILDEIKINRKEIIFNENDINVKEKKSKVFVDLDINNSYFSVSESFEEGFGSREFSGGIDQYKNELTFLYYKSSRTFRSNLKQNKKNISSYISSFDSFLEWFEEQENLENEIRLRDNIAYKLPSLQAIRDSIELFFSNLTSTNFYDLRIVRTEKSYVNGKAYPKFKIRKGTEIDLSLDQLSDGEKMTLMLVVDIAKNLITKKTENKNPLENKGIVLVDEIELHLHPSWQREIIPALMKTFPNVQFIVTTHSPQVLSNIDGNNVFIIDNFNLVDTKIYTKGRDSNSILFDVFGEEKRPKEYRDKISLLYEYIDKNDKEKANNLLSELESNFGTEDIEIQRALMYLEDL